jgi:hypothetical protein
MGIKETTSTSKFNILTNSVFDSLDLTQHTNEIFGIIDDDKAYDFAESERQKSKNLFNKYGDLSYLVGNTISDVPQVLSDGTIKTNDNSAGWRGRGQLIGGLKTNTKYVISGTLIRTTSPATNNAIVVAFIGGTTTQLGLKYISYVDTPVDFSLTINTGDNNSIWFYVGSNNPSSSGTKYEAIFDNIQVEEGSVATEYQPYNGAIVNEKQLNEAVKKRSLLYNYETSQSINITTSTLTTLKEFWDLFCLDRTKTYRISKGSNETTNFTNIITLPSGLTDDYIFILIREHIHSGNQDYYTSFEMHLFNSTGLKHYVSYLSKGWDAVIRQSNWLGV